MNFDFLSRYSEKVDDANFQYYVKRCGELIIQRNKKEIGRELLNTNVNCIRKIMRFIFANHNPKVPQRFIKIAIKLERLDIIKLFCERSTTPFPSPSCDTVKYLNDKLTLTAARSGCLLSLSMLYDYGIAIHPRALEEAAARGHFRCVIYIHNAEGKHARAIISEGRCIGYDILSIY
jgi:hypothetical protein